MARYDDEDEEDKKEEKPQAPDLSDKFLKTRTILLTGEVNKALAERIVRHLLLLEAESSDPIKLLIDSPGGDVNAGFAIFDMIRFVNAPVYTVGMGLVASAGALILLAAPKDRRIGLPNSQYLIHQPLSGMRGVATEIEIHAREMEKMRVKLNQLIADETGKPIAEVEKHTDRDYWLDAAEAVNYGLLSRIAAKRADLGV